MAYNATELRRNIYRILDRVLETGEAVDVERRGRRLRIVPADAPAASRSVPPMEDLIVGDPADLDDVDWTSAWNP